MSSEHRFSLLSVVIALSLLTASASGKEISPSATRDIPNCPLLDEAVELSREIDPGPLHDRMQIYKKDVYSLIGKALGENKASSTKNYQAAIVKSSWKCIASSVDMKREIAAWVAVDEAAGSLEQCRWLDKDETKDCSKEDRLIAEAMKGYKAIRAGNESKEPKAKE
jgi:hypothetical protein